VITVTKFIEVPDTAFPDDESALDHIREMYGLTEWLAINNVVAFDSMNGLSIDLPDTLESYYDPELQTFVFTIQEIVPQPYEKPIYGEVYRDEGDNPIEGVVGYETAMRDVVVLQKRAVSFLLPDHEDNEDDAPDA